MVDLKLQDPAADEVLVDGDTMAAIQRGIEASNQGQELSAEEVRNLLPKWISRYSTPNPR